jgi:hypothetical protein
MHGAVGKRLQESKEGAEDGIIVVETSLGEC